MHWTGDTLGLLEESLQLARDLGYEIREEPLGELAGGGCTIGGKKVLLVNLEHAAAERLGMLVRFLASVPAARQLPMSRLLAGRLNACLAGDDRQG